MTPPELPFLTVAGDNTLLLSAYIQPRASKCEICGIQGQELKIRLTSPPVDGAANRLCRKFIAEVSGVPVSMVEIISGETSRHKRIRINADPDSIIRRIAASCNQIKAERQNL